MANPLNNNQNAFDRLSSLIDMSQNPQQFIMSKLQGNQQLQGQFSQMKQMGNLNDKQVVTNILGKYGITPEQVEMLGKKLGIK